MVTFACNDHGLLRQREDGLYESWRGGVYRTGGFAATEKQFKAALANSNAYGPTQYATVRRWYTEFIAQQAPIDGPAA